MIRRILSNELERELERNNLRGYIKRVGRIAQDIIDNLHTREGYTLITQNHVIPSIREDMLELKKSLEGEFKGHRTFRVDLTNGNGDEPTKLSLTIYKRG